jgi:hypothetical protein
LNSNVNSAAKSLNGFAGVTLISVNLAIKDNVLEIMSLEKLKISYQNVKVPKNVQLEEITPLTEMSMHLVVVYAETLKIIKKISDAFNFLK